MNDYLDFLVNLVILANLVNLDLLEEPENLPLLYPLNGRCASPELLNLFSAC